MNTEKYSIRSLLESSTAFFIPPFQRSYAWGIAEIDRYFSDVIRIIKSELNPNEKDKQEHFFGTAVIKQETKGFNNISIIVDGQQRITTSLLFLIALRDWTKNQNEKDFIKDSFLINNRSQYPNKIKLKQVTKDWECYRALIVGTNVKPSLLKNAYNRFFKLIKETSENDARVNFEQYVNALYRMNIAVIFLDERPFKGEDPQIIFETLNSLGKLLTLADLIRNNILLGFNDSDQTDIYEKEWFPKIEEPLGENVSDFFRDYLQYKTANYVKEATSNNAKEIYFQYQNFIKSFNNKKDFVIEIVQYAKFYSWMVTETISDDISNDKENDKTIKELLRNIFFDLTASAFRCFILGLLYHHEYENYSDSNLIRDLKIIRSYLTRRRLLGLTKGENKSIPTLCAKKITDAVLGIENLNSILAKQFWAIRFPNDNEIKDCFKVLNLYKDRKRLCKYILGKIEEYNSKVSVDFRSSKITIEHIMPQTLNSNWENHLGTNYQAIFDSYCHNIGNLILTEFNSEMGNRPFDEKKNELKKSNLNYRLEILDTDNWNETAIINHQEKMISDFLKEFSLPKEYQDSQTQVIAFKNVKNFYITDPNAEDIIINKKPCKMIFDGILNKQTIWASSWNELYIAFMKFINDNYDPNLGSIRESKEYSGIVTFSEISASTFDFKNFKTLDNLRLSNLNSNQIKKDSICLYITTNAADLLRKIERIMNYFKIPADKAEIELQ